MGDLLEYQGKILADIHEELRGNDPAVFILETEGWDPLQSLLNLPPEAEVTLGSRKMNCDTFRVQVLSRTSAIFTDHMEWTRYRHPELFA